MFTKTLPIAAVLVALAASPAQASIVSLPILKGPAPVEHKEEASTPTPAEPSEPTPKAPSTPATPAPTTTTPPPAPTQTVVIVINESNDQTSNTSQPGDVEKAGTPAAKKLTELAQQYWGYEPTCPGGYHVYVNRITDQPPNPDGTGTEAAGEAAVPGCFMRIIPSYWEETLSPGEQTEDTCAVFIHEYGHSLGHPHTTDPNSVMNPFTMYSTGMPSECKELAAEPEKHYYFPGPKSKKAHAASHKRHKKHRRHVRKQRIGKPGAPDGCGAAPFLLALDPFGPSLLD